MAALTFDDVPAAAGPPRALPQYGDAIAKTESGGRYDITGPVTRTGDRAYGKYQVMGANIGPWSKEVLGVEISPQQFLANPQVQDAIFNAKFRQYENKYGPEGAARAWFAGAGGMNDLGRRDQLGTSVADYGAKFMRNMGGQPEAQVMQVADRAQPPQSPQAQQPQQPQQAQPSPRTALTFDDVPAAAPAAKDRGVTDAVARGAASGLSFGFGDELQGLAEAGGAKQGEIAGLGQLVRGGYRYARGNPEAVKQYNETVARERASEKQVQEQHPIAYTGGVVGGSLVLPVGAGAQAATLPGRIAQGVAVGAAVGGLSGVGEGVGATDSIARGITGAGIGGVTGGALPVAVEGVIRGGRAVATPVANAVRGIRDTDTEAARRVAVALQRDAQADPGAVSRLTPQEFTGNVQGGGPATLMDLGGDTTRALARSAANTSPEGRGVLNRAINDRFEGQSGRVTDWLNHQFNFPDAAAQQAAIDNVERTVNRANYGVAMREGNRPLWDADLEQITSAPIVHDAIRGANKTIGNKAAVAGERRPVLPFELASDGTILPPKNNKPTLQYWDAVKRNLDDKISSLTRAGEREAANDARQLRTALVEKLDALVPSYQTARAGAAAFFGAENALEAGQNFATASLGRGQLDQARQALARMNPQQRQLFQDGFVSRYVETLRARPDRRNIINQITGSPAAREQMELALGPQRAQQLEANLRAEGIMDLARGAVQGNSTTARQLVELGLAGGAGLAGNGLDFSNIRPSAVMSAALVYGAARGRGRVNEAVARRVADMLTSQDPNLIRRGAQIVASNQNMLNSLRRFDQGLVRIGGGQAPVGVPGLSAAGVSRADENQQSVPGPVAQ